MESTTNPVESSTYTKILEYVQNKKGRRKWRADVGNSSLRTVHPIRFTVKIMFYMWAAAEEKEKAKRSEKIAKQSHKTKTLF